jgi:menaquinone-dependent protoporphyrinogen oxidase
MAVLVAYASRFGSTKGVAERIGAGLQAADGPVDVRPADQVGDVTAYHAVVLGSAIFNQRWLPEAEQFVHRSTGELARRPVWLFSVGTFGDTRRVVGPLMKRAPKDIHEMERAIHPRDYRVFAGVIDRHRWPFPSRLLYHALGGRLGDNRDWPAIDAWTAEIRRALRRRVVKGKA